MDLARLVAADVDTLIDNARKPLIDPRQLREAAHSVPANIREAYGRREGKERKQFLVYARGSAEETDEHLRGNSASGRVSRDRYWRIHNRIAVIVKILDRLI